MLDESEEDFSPFENLLEIPLSFPLQTDKNALKDKSSDF